IAAQWLEVLHLKLKATIPEMNQLAQLLAVRIFSIGRQPHDFAFITVFFVADEFAEHGVEAPQRMRKKNSFQHLDVIAFASSHHGGDKIARTVVAEACCTLAGRTDVGAGSV